MFLTSLLIGIGLSMDAFAVSISGGLSCKKVSLKDTLKISVVFGLFQALMPLLGYYTGNLFKGYIEGFDHYLAFMLLSAIGIKMIYEGIKKDGCEIRPFFFRNSNILLLGLVTSIDAFIAGLGLSMSGIQVFPAVLIIGITTFIFSAIGVRLGCRLGCRFEKGADIFGGIILFILGAKMLLEGLGLF